MNGESARFPLCAIVLSQVTVFSTAVNPECELLIVGIQRVIAYLDSAPYTLSRYPELAARMTIVTGNSEPRFG